MTTTGDERRRTGQVFDQRCGPCGDGLEHCHGTLVLHADGTLECDEASVCGGREDGHGWWLACVEVDCGCAGDEEDGPVVGEEVVLLAA